MEISILNLNCWLLPAPLAADCKIRVSKIADVILAYEPDIVTLQEVWTNSDLAYLKRRLALYHCVSSGSRLYNQSGLVTFLKAKPISSRMTFFKRSVRHNATEWIARKGYLEVDIEIQGVTRTIVNTHLYAAFTIQAESIAEEQFSELVSKVSTIQSITCGDLNLSEAEFEKVNEGRLQRLCDSQNTFDELNPYKHQKFNAIATGIEGGKIDYMTYANMTISHVEYRVIKNPFVSDHYMTHCLLTI